MNLLLLLVNYVATMAVVSMSLKKRRFLLLDPAWAFLGGYFINYCVRPTLFLIDPELGTAYPGFYDDQAIRRGLAAAMAFALAGLAGFALGNLGVRRASPERWWAGKTTASEAFTNGKRRVSKQRANTERASGQLPNEERARPHPSSKGSSGGEPRGAERRALVWIAASLLLVACWGLYRFISEAGFVGTILELLGGGQRSAFMEVIVGNGLYMFAMQLSLLAWAILCLHWLTSRAPPTPGARLSRRLGQAVAFLITLGIWVSFGERSTILAVIFIPLALRQLRHRRAARNQALRQPSAQPPKSASRTARPLRQRLALAALAAACFAIAGPLGLLMKGLDVSPAAAISLSISAWDNFEFTVVALERVRERQMLWGASYWGDMVYTWLPRAVFPWKPARYGSMVVQDLVEPEFMDREGATFPPGILVEAYCNFGYAGAFLVPLLIGRFCQTADRRLRQEDWLWVVAMSVCFTNLASFRGIGGFAALLLAYAVCARVALAAARSLPKMRGALASLQPPSPSPELLPSAPPTSP